MKDALAIQIQAYLDGELSAEDTLQLLAQLEIDSEARQFCEALKVEKTFLNHVGEKAYEMPVAHSYFWKGVANGIQSGGSLSRVESSRAPARNLRQWLSWLVPVGITACIALVALHNGYLGSVIDGIKSTSKKAARRAPSFHEIDSQQQNAGFISFRSESEGVSVVWISNY